LTSRAWAAFTYQKPAAPISPRIEVFQDVELDRQDTYWQPYKFPTDAAAAERPSQAIETAKEFAKLNQIIHETINIYCGSRGRVTMTGILQMYQRYLQWKKSSEERLDSTSPLNNPLPHVTNLQ